MSQNFQRWLIEETTLPRFYKTVDTLLETLINPEGLKRNLFFALLLVLMNENDFLLLKESGSSISIVDCITSLYRRNNEINEAIFILKGFEASPIKLIQSPLGDIVIKNIFIPYLNRRTLSICLPLNRYVTTTELGLPGNFFNLNAFCISFKESVILPVKSSIHNYNGLPNSSLAGLPTDIIRKVLLILPVEDILNLSESCKRINEIVNEDCLWYHLYDRDFADKHKKEATLATEWYRDMYKEKYLKMKEEKVATTLNENNLNKIEMSGFLMYSCIPDPRWEVIL